MRISKSLYTTKGSTNYLMQDQSVECCILVMACDTCLIYSATHNSSAHIQNFFCRPVFSFATLMQRMHHEKKMLTKVA